MQFPASWFACKKINIRLLIYNLESDTTSAVVWFDANYMKPNQSKYNVLLPSQTPELFWIRLADQVIWESRYEKLLGVTVDKDLKFHQHLKNLCKKASAKIAEDFTLLFVESQFQYCPLVWKFNISRKMNNRLYEDSSTTC